MGKIHHGEGRVIRQCHSSWYDHTYMLYPFTGDFDFARMHEALRKRIKFSQFNSIGAIEQVGPGYIEVEHIYHIGD